MYKQTLYEKEEIGIEEHEIEINKLEMLLKRYLFFIDVYAGPKWT